MKKKIKNMTAGELIDSCKNTSCTKCPFNDPEYKNSPCPIGLLRTTYDRCLHKKMKVLPKPKNKTGNWITRIIN